MTNSFIRVPADSSGKRVAAQQRTRGVDDIQFQEVLASYQVDTISTAANVTTSSTQILAATANRRALLIQNVSDTLIMVRFATAPVATVGSEVGIAVMPNGGAILLDSMVDARLLNAIHAGTGTKRLCLTEWVDT